MDTFRNFGLRCVIVLGDGESLENLARLAVPLVGALEETGDRWLPFQLTDPAGSAVEAVSAFFRDLQASGRSEATLRSYGHDLLRWFRFLWAIEVPWARVTEVPQSFRTGDPIGSSPERNGIECREKRKDTLLNSRNRPPGR